jgi:hypothetical protein
MNSLLRNPCITTLCFVSFGVAAQGAPSLEVRCGKYLKAAPKDKALLDGVIIGYFQGYNQGVVAGSNDDRRALTLRGASTKDMFHVRPAYCSNHPEAMIQGPLLTYIVAADAGSLDALRLLK